MLSANIPYCAAIYSSQVLHLVVINCAFSCALWACEMDHGTEGEVPTGSAGSAGESVCSLGRGCNRVILVGCESLTCRLCGSNATSLSPLISPIYLAKYGKTVPWAGYSPVTVDGEQCRKPKGRFCMICRNVFNVSGLEDLHTSLAAFYSFTCMPQNADHGRTFMANHASWIEKANTAVDDGQSACRLKGGKELKERATSLNIKHKEFSEFESPDWDLVTKDAWCPQKDGGAYDPDKEVQAEVFGVMRTGIWVQRGRSGVFKWKQKESKGIEQSTLDDDGTQPFAKERLDRKLHVFRQGQANFEKERKQKSIDASSSSGLAGILSMLSSAGITGNEAAPRAGCQTGAPDEVSGLSPCPPKHEQSSGPTDADDEDADEDEPGASPKVVLSQLFPFGSKPKASAAKAQPKQSANTRSLSVPASVTPKSGPKKSGNSGLSLQRHHTQHLEASLGKRAHELREEPISTALMDGRTQRIKLSLEGEASRLGESLDGIGFDEDIRTGGDKRKKAALTDWVIRI